MNKNIKTSPNVYLWTLGEKYSYLLCHQPVSIALINQLFLNKRKNILVEALCCRGKQAVWLAAIFNQAGTRDRPGGCTCRRLDGNRIVVGAVNDQCRHGEGCQIVAEIGFAKCVNTVMGGFRARHDGQGEAPVQQRLADRAGDESDPVKGFGE